MVPNNSPTIYRIYISVANIYEYFVNYQAD